MWAVSMMAWGEGMVLMSFLDMKANVEKQKNPLLMCRNVRSIE
jgi:hypothetical protein